jgi:hypothetical protein
LLWSLQSKRSGSCGKRKDEEEEEGEEVVSEGRRTFSCEARVHQASNTAPLRALDAHDGRLRSTIYKCLYWMPVDLQVHVQHRDPTWPMVINERKHYELISTRPNDSGRFSSAAVIFSWTFFNLICYKEEWWRCSRRYLNPNECLPVPRSSSVILDS